MSLKVFGLTGEIMDSIKAAPIGYVRSHLIDRSQAPRQGRDAAVEAWIEILPAYREALQGIDRWPQLLIVCWMHLAKRDTRTVHPRGDPRAPLTGVFATRSPARPNPLAVYTVELLSCDGGKLHVRGIDAVEGTPVLDIKPHVHRLDD